MSVTRGLGNLREKSEEEFANRPKKAWPKRNKPGFFSLDDQETVILRFVEEGDEWLGPKQHGFVQTKDEPAGYQGNWPKNMNAVCRYDDIIDGDECYICDNGVTNSWGKPSFPSRKVYTIAQVREAVKGDGSEEMGGPENKGKVLFYAPKLIEVDEFDDEGNATGEKIEIPEFLIINQSLDAFSGPLEVHFNDYETLRDRDYRVTRMGTGVKTQYLFNPVPQGVDEDYLPGTELWKEYVDEPLEKMGVNLLKDLEYRGSEDYYARWFDPTKTVEQKGSDSKGAKGSGGSSNFKSKAAKKSANPTVDNDALAAARAKLHKFKSGS